MPRADRVETKVYPGGSGWRILTYAMVFVSFMLVISGLLGKDSAPADLTVIPSQTPAPTAIAQVFDETPDEREISIASQTWYTIQLGIYESQTSAQELADNYRARGAAGYLWQDGARFRVLAAVYDNQEDAQSVRSQLRENQNIDSYIYTIEPVCLTLRLKGMKGQLDGLQAAFEALEATPLDLLKLSIRLDRQEADTNEVKAVLGEKRDALIDLARLLEERFLKPYHPLVEQLIPLLSQWNQRLTEAASFEGSAAALAGMLKRENLALIESAQSYYQQIAQ